MVQQESTKYKQITLTFSIKYQYGRVMISDLTFKYNV